jgi:hypothetical protein
VDSQHFTRGLASIKRLESSGALLHPFTGWRAPPGRKASGPVQWRRERGTLYDIPRKRSLNRKKIINIGVGVKYG